MCDNSLQPWTAWEYNRTLNNKAVYRNLFQQMSISLPWEQCVYVLSDFKIKLISVCLRTEMKAYKEKIGILLPVTKFSKSRTNGKWVRSICVFTEQSVEWERQIADSFNV